MKTIFLFLFTICTTIVTAQSVPYLFNYQAVARDLNGQPLANQSLSVKFSIASAPGGTAIWTQNFDNINTNEFGLFSLSVGDTKLRNIPWKNGSFYLNAEITSNGSATAPAPAQLLSVPYALVADTVLHAPASSGGTTYSQGTGIKIDNVNKIISIDTATAGFPKTLPPNGTAGGDLGGTYPTPSVVALRGKNITATPPTTGQVLKFDGTNWGPGADNTGGAGSRTNYTGDNIIKVDTINYKISLASGTKAGQFYKYDGTVWVLDSIKTTGGGTTYSQGTGIKIDNVNKIISIDTATAGFPKTLPPNGTAGGDLGGTYPTPSVVALRGKNISTTPPTTGQVLKFDGMNWSPGADSIGSAGGTGGWSLTGNTGTSATTNFIGTTDNTPLIFKVNGAPAGRIEPTATGGNTAFGYRTLSIVNTGIQNTATGESTLGLNATGNYNTAIGYRALSSNASGRYNTAVGDSTLLANLDGSSNTAIGATALAANTTGILNEATGINALRLNQTGNSNTANGADALFFNNGNSNTAVGNAAMFLNVNGSNNTAVGVTAAYSGKGSNTTAVGSGALKNNTADNATAVGSGSMFNNTSGSGNTAVGFNSLYKNIGGSLNTAVGEQALFNNTTGSNNVASGYQALYSNTTTGDGNMASGYKALYSNTTGTANVASGYQALYSNIDGGFNVASGNLALFSNINGKYNVASGSEALYANNGGNYNVASGWQALYANTTGNNNVAIGLQTLYANINGGNNVASGYQALYSNTSGSRNVAIGLQAIYYNTTGSNNTTIGTFAGTGNFAALDNTIAIGYQATVLGTNKAVIGNTSINSIGGQVGWSTLSDGRFKENISEDVPGLRFISKLRPVTYRVNRKKINDFVHRSAPTNTDAYLKKNFAPALDAPNADNTLSDVTTGFVAQEVEKAAQAVGFDFSGVDKPKNSNDYYGLRYAEFTVPLVKAVQELKAENDALKAKNDELLKWVAQIKSENIEAAQKTDNLKKQFNALEAKVNKLLKSDGLTNR